MPCGFQVSTDEGPLDPPHPPAPQPRRAEGVPDAQRPSTVSVTKPHSRLLSSTLPMFFLLVLVNCKKLKQICLKGNPWSEQVISTRMKECLKEVFQSAFPGSNGQVACCSTLSVTCPSETGRQCSSRPFGSVVTGN